MKDRQLEYGNEMIKAIAEEWGVTVDQAAKILLSKRQREFFAWVGAMEFLEDELYK